MKTFLLTSIFFFLAIIALAQKSGLIEDYNLLIKKKTNFQEQFDFHVPDNSVTEIKNRVDSIIYVTDNNTLDNYTIKETFTYDSNGNLLSDLQQVEHEGAWSDILIFTYTYDDSGNRLTQLRRFFENDSTLMNQSLFTYSYGIDNYKQSELWQRWVDNTWLNDYLYTVTYDASGKVLSEKHQSWEDNLWTNKQLSSYSYDNDGKCLTYIGQVWHNNEWENSWIENYTYNESGNLVVNLNQSWEDNAWLNMWKHTYTYDNKGNNLTWSVKRWINGEWIDLFIETYSYDQNNNRTLVLNQIWAVNEWINYTKEEFVFNPEVVNAIALEWNENYWDESSVDQYIEVIVGGYNLAKITAKSASFYYSDITGIESMYSGLFNSPLHCYPNPVMDKINIDIVSDWQSSNYILELYTLYGQKVRSILVEPNPNICVFSFSMEELPYGIYLLSANNGKQVFTQKIIHVK